MAMMKPLDVPPLGLSEKEAEIQFEKLQAKLIPLWWLSQASEMQPDEVARPCTSPELVGRKGAWGSRM